MGTSQSSGGPGGGVPMVPPWTPPPPPADTDGGTPGAGDDGETPADAGNPEISTPAPPASGTASPSPPPPAPSLVAPSGRFKGARLSLGDYARTGDRSDLQRGLGRYVGSGYGGSRSAVRRFGGTAATASNLGNALASVAAGQPAAPGSALDPTLLAGRAADEIMDAVVEAVRPVDGSQDAEAERASIRDALTELLTQFPDADLLNLNPDQRSLVIERFAAIDVFRRFELDLGKTIVEKAPTAAAALARLKQARDYIKEAVAASFRRLRETGRTLTAGRINQVVGDALRGTFEVFEGYAQ